VVGAYRRAENGAGETSAREQAGAPSTTAVIDGLQFVSFADGRRMDGAEGGQSWVSDATPARDAQAPYTAPGAMDRTARQPSARRRRCACESRRPGVPADTGLGTPRQRPDNNETGTR